GEEAYHSCLYLNFDEEKVLHDFFSHDLNPTKIIENLQIYKNQIIEPGQTLLIFDEVQECPAALNSLKYFNEQANEYHIIAAGSLLGVKLGKARGFPVGKVNFMHLYPLTFF